jgi:cytochrome c
MNIIPTAEEFIKNEIGLGFKKEYPTLYNNIIEQIKKFTKLHVKEALEEAANKAEITKAYQYTKPFFGSVYKERINKDSILNAYSEDNIK